LVLDQFVARLFVAPSIRRIPIRGNQFVAMYLLQLINRNLFVAMNDSQTF
jgi:hypothetical protein